MRPNAAAALQRCREPERSVPSLPTQGWGEEGGVGLLRPGNPSPATVATKGAAAALG